MYTSDSRERPPLCETSSLIGRQPSSFYERRLKLSYSCTYDIPRIPQSETSSSSDSQSTSFDEHSIQWSYSLPYGTIFYRAVYCIFFTELFRQLAFYGVVGNLFLFSTSEDQLNLTPSTASILLYAFLDELEHGLI